jgi:hypothetical protein
MKNTPLIVVVSALLFASGCSQSDREETKQDAKAIVRDVKTAATETWADFKDYSYEKRADLAASLYAMTRKLDAEISELQAGAADAKASASRSAAWQRLRDARADFGAKTEALGRATADTWASAQAEAKAAWKNLQAAYAEAKADASSAGPPNRTHGAPHRNTLPGRDPFIPAFAFHGSDQPPNRSSQQFAMAECSFSGITGANGSVSAAAKSATMAATAFSSAAISFGSTRLRSSSGR